MWEVKKWLAEIDQKLFEVRVIAESAYQTLDEAQKRYSLLCREVECLEKARKAIETLDPNYVAEEVPL